MTAIPGGALKHSLQEWIKEPLSRFTEGSGGDATPTLGCRERVNQRSWWTRDNTAQQWESPAFTDGPQQNWPNRLLSQVSFQAWSPQSQHKQQVGSTFSFLNQSLILHPKRWVSEGGGGGGAEGGEEEGEGGGESRAGERGVVSTWHVINCSFSFLNNPLKVVTSIIPSL